MSLKNLTKQEFECISAQLSTELLGLGLEHYPFTIEWYNQMVSTKFKLDFDDRCLAFVIISTPDMFEQAFIPYLKSTYTSSNVKRATSDSIDECMKYYLNRVKQRFSGLSIQIIHDFELLMPSRKPKVLCQTAAHVSGAAYYYKSDLIEDNSPGMSNRKAMGVCIHPVFGGWFAIRAVLVFTQLTCDSLKQRQPKDVIPSVEQKINLLNMFNQRWWDGNYRDIIPVKKRYSDSQIKYFSLKPSERKPFLKELIEL